MRNYLSYLIFGIIFVTPAEYIIQTMIVPNGSFLGTIFIYVLLLSIYYFVYGKKHETKASRRIRITESILLGAFGIFIMEWMIIGNSPTGNPDALQSSMFIWWIWVFLFPKVMVSPLYKSMRTSLLSFHIVFSLSFWIFMIAVKNPLAFIPIYAYGLLGFYYFLYRYITLEL